MMSIEGVRLFCEREVAKDPNATIKLRTLLEAITYNEPKCLEVS